MKNSVEDLSKYNPEGSDLRRAQLKMLDILIEVAKICDNNNIPYWLTFGTLLGAVRHKGFIPWDDDLDIEIEDKYFKKLVKCLELELPETMKLQYEGNDRSYFQKFAKVRDINSIIYEDSSIDFKERGLFIDIFPSVYSTNILDKISKKILGGSNSYLKCSLYKNKSSKFHQKFVLKIRLLIYSFIIKINAVVFKILKNNTLFSPVFNIGVNKNIIFPLENIIFEDHTFKCPYNPDKYLKLFYGNYMKLPLPVNRISHATKIEFFK